MIATSGVIAPNPLRFVLVIWDDAWKSSVDDSTPKTAHEDHKPKVECAAGWVLRDNAKGITIGASYSDGKESDGSDWSHRNQSFVPRRMITHVIEVPLPRIDDPEVLALGRVGRKRKTKKSAPNVVEHRDPETASRETDVH